MKDLNIFKQRYVYRNPLRNIKDFLRRFKYAYQRITKGYCDTDLWNLDYYLICLLSEALKEFSETTYSYPMNLTEEEWRQKLLEMSNHFSNISEYTNNDINNRAEKSFDDYWDSKGTDKEDKLYNNWIEISKDAFKFREEEKNKAFDMIKEWFFDLWD